MFHHIKCRYCVNPIGEKLWWINVELTKYILYSGKQAEPREVPRYRSVTLCQVAAVRCLQEAAHVHPGHGHRLKNFTKTNRKNSTQNVPTLPCKELRTSLTEFLWSHFFNDNWDTFTYSMFNSAFTELTLFQPLSALSHFFLKPCLSVQIQ